MSYVVAIDVGVKNLAICVFDFVTSKIVYWRNLSLAHSGRYCPSDNVVYVHAFIEAHKQYFSSARAVLIERQCV